MKLPRSVRGTRWAPALFLILASCGGDDSSGTTTDEGHDASVDAAVVPGLDGGTDAKAPDSSASPDAVTIDVSANSDASSFVDVATSDVATTDVATVPDAEASTSTDAVAETSAPVDASAIDAGPDAVAPPIDAGVDAQTSAPVIVKTGQAGQLLLRGMIVTPDTAFAGEVLIEGNTITCAAASCASSPAAASATVVETHGVIAPGMIDTHNRVLFDIFDENDWSPTKVYNNHTQWTSEPRYSAMIDAKQYLNGESGPLPLPDLGCEMDKYGEMKGLVAGTTTILGAPNPSRSCYGSLARSIDTTYNDLGIGDKIQVATLFPQTSSADSVCNNFTSGNTLAYFIYVGEGTDATALGEFSKLNTITTVDGCLLSPKTTIVHGTALGDAEFTTMAAHSMNLTWSPRSNVFLYGGGTDLTKTANVPLALSKGINVSIGPDWSLGGSQNMLDELRFADQVDNTQWGNILSAQMLVQMATTHPAKALGLDAMIGSIAVGKRADLFVISGDTSDPFGSVLKATPKEVNLVLVDGVSLYGDAGLKALGPGTPGCEDLTICTSAKFACVAETGATAKIGQTFAQISSILSQALTDYDAMNLTAFKFAPITPVVRCP